jgi:hypothetical protein
MSDLKISKVPKISKKSNDNHEIVKSNDNHEIVKSNDNHEIVKSNDNHEIVKSNDSIEHNIKFNIKTINPYTSLKNWYMDKCGYYTTDNDWDMVREYARINNIRSENYFKEEPKYRTPPEILNSYLEKKHKSKKKKHFNKISHEIFWYNFMLMPMHISSIYMISHPGLYLYILVMTGCSGLVFIAKYDKSPMNEIIPMKICIQREKILKNLKE